PKETSRQHRVLVRRPIDLSPPTGAALRSLPGSRPVPVLSVTFLFTAQKQVADAIASEPEECDSTFYFDAVPGPYAQQQPNNMYYPVHEQRFQPSFPDAYHRVTAPQFEQQYPSAALSMGVSQQPAPPQTILPTAPLPRPSTVSPCEQTSLSSPTLTSNSGSAASETPPISGETISTDLEGPDNERVMCMACRGVYPSRRSLTGHIGRNEKCREIIGRNYLDQVAMGANPIAPGTENAIKAGALTNGHDGLSPICPHCDRFISHYKGNIRRHINQCGKNESPQKRPRADKDRRRDAKRRRHDESMLPHVLHEGFDPATGTQNSGLLGSPVMSPSLGSYLHEQDLQQDGMAYMNGHSMEQQIQLPSDPSPPGGPRKEADPPETVVQTDFTPMHYGYDMMNSFPQL
ncbi:hypothetical protein TELCIR_08114, partial [Teladorsagia circumcincta]